MKPCADKTRAIAYLRVSTDDQQLGPDAQRASIGAYCRSHGVTIMAELADIGVSGAAKLEDRPGMLLALSALKEHGAGLLIVAKRDRLARDVITAAMIEAGCERVGARIVSAAGEGTDGAANDPTALLMRRMVDAFAEYERAVIAARTRAALAVKASKGERVGGLPYGWADSPNGGAMVPVAHEQAVIELARGMRAAGRSLGGIGQDLAALGHYSRTGAVFAPVQVQRMIGEVR